MVITSTFCLKWFGNKVMRCPLKVEMMKENENGAKTMKAEPSTTRQPTNYARLFARLFRIEKGRSIKGNQLGVKWTTDYAAESPSSKNPLSKGSHLCEGSVKKIVDILYRGHWRCLLMRVSEDHVERLPTVKNQTP
ncbi:hypothetical protein M9H77_17828 [Catharanthus roseus]|uniref:Uncharacterized protein n=1 Tax=Catharanthus roseus TaxID=4058 RepID=A0ACC0B5P6_CATRO|nr:hypothetical protein M9H77_17828 [Catharanthus roseus]